MKAIKYFALVAVVALMGACMTSCGGFNGKAKDLIVKNDDGKLTEEDYAKMIEMISDYNESYNNDWEKAIEKNPEYKDYKFAKQELKAKYGVDYTYADDIKSILNGAGEKKMGKENKDAWDKVTTTNSDRKKALENKEPKQKEGNGGGDSYDEE